MFTGFEKKIIIWTLKCGIKKKKETISRDVQCIGTFTFVRARDSLTTLRVCSRLKNDFYFALAKNRFVVETKISNYLQRRETEARREKSFSGNTSIAI